MADRAALRRLAVWLVGITIVVVVMIRIPFAAFRDAITHGPHLTLAAVDFAVTFAVLCTDALATQWSLRATAVHWTFAQSMLVRGSTYLLAVLNYAVGQAGLGYYLHRSGVTASRAVGVTLFLTGTTFAALLVLTTGSWASYQPSGTMWWTLVGGCGAFAVYLAVIALRPRFVADRAPLAPLFDAKVSGHLLAVAARLPHVAMLTMSFWIAMRAWGLAMPFGVAASVMPGVVIATVLPISPAGLGTAQAALVFLCADFAPGATADARQANILAFSLVHFVYGVLGQVVLGAFCTAVLRKQQRATETP
jgi:hypothetical protein